MPFDYRNLSARDMLDELSIRVFEPPLSELRYDLQSVSRTLRDVMLFIDFDTEVSMNGILGFLENLSGRYFAETIQMFEHLGATKTATILRGIEEILTKEGVTYEMLRADFEGHSECEITSFAKLHGEDVARVGRAIDAAARGLYIYRPDAEDAYELISQHIERNRPEIDGALGAIGV